MKKRNGLFSRSKNKVPANAESISVCCLEDAEDDFMFSEGEVSLGKSVATFSFGSKENESTESRAAKSSPPSNNMEVRQFYAKESSSTAAQRGVTPPIDGEYFTMKRGYQFRPSTIRKLNELKTMHPDLNVYLNTILDAAILHYYNYITNENGQFT